MRTYRDAVCAKNDGETTAYRVAGGAGLVLGGVALLVGCASGPPPNTRHTGTGQVVANVGDVRSSGTPARKTRYMLIALPDRVYDVPVSMPARTAVVPANVARASESVPVSVALAGAVAYPLVEPASVPIVVTALPDVMLGVPATAMLAMADQALKPPTHLSAVAEAAMPKLKMDTDYEFAAQPARFAFNRNKSGA